MKYNIGDKVVINERQAEIAAKHIPYQETINILTSLAGKQVTISGIIGDQYYKIEEDELGCYWDEEMFEDIECEYNVEEINVLYG